MKRLALIFVITVLTIATGVWFANQGFSSSPTVPPEPATGMIAANGLIEGTTPEVALRTDGAGTIRVIAFRENQRVRKGDVLVELVNDAQQQQVALAKAECDVAAAELERVRNGETKEQRDVLSAKEGARKAAFEQASKNWERARRLLANSSISRQEYDNAQHDMQRTEQEWLSAQAEHRSANAPARQDELNAATARVEAATARWRLALAELAKTRILAPSDGCVLQVLGEPGDHAGPATSRPVLLFADVSRFRVRAFVEELDAPRVASGQSATVTIDGLPGKTFHGVVGQIMPRMSQRGPHSDAPGELRDLHYREVLVELEDAEGLIVNLRANVRIAARR